MKKRLFTFIVSVLILFSHVHAQQHYCAAMENVKDQIRLDSNLKTRLLRIEQEIEEQIHAGSRSGTLTIPVVFHVIHNGDAYGSGENITDEQVLSQLDALNRDFNNRNADTSLIPSVFKPMLGNMNVEFCLARFDESGMIFSGIVRHNLGVSAWDRTAMETNAKPSTIWNPDAYLNIWIARFTGDLNGVLGYAQFPGMSPSTDGIVLRYDCVGTTGPRNAGNEMGRVATHEVGHWMSLYHIWGDDGGEPNECLGSDSVADTPNQRIEFYGTPTHPQVSCSQQNMFMNYMDYVDDSAKFMFTAGQVARARASLLSQRGQLLAANTICKLDLDAEFLDIISPTDSACLNSIVPIIRFRNNGRDRITYIEMIYNFDGGINKTTRWYGNIGPRELGYISLPEEVLSNGMHSISIFLTNANNRGNDDYVLNDNATKNFYVNGTGTIGLSTPFSEGFESSSIPLDWVIQNPNSDRTWTLNTGTGAYGTSAQSISFNNFDPGSNPTNRIDNLITPAYNLDATNFPYIQFDVAYAPRTGPKYDTLSMYVSVDCNASWTLIWKQGGTELATQDELNSLFYPNSSQWKTVRVDITPFMNLDHVQFKFENKSGWGNMLYLDNININSYGVAVPEIKTNLGSPNIYPNPATNELHVVNLLPQDQLTIYDIAGNKIKEALNKNSEAKITISDLAKGIYFIKIEHIHVQPTIIKFVKN